MNKLIVIIICGFVGFVFLGGWGILLGAVVLTFIASSSEPNSMFSNSTDAHTDDLDIDNYGASFSDTFSENSFEDSTDSSAINPATGLPMIGGVGGVDSGGSPFGTDLNGNFDSSIDDSFPSSGFDDSISSGFDDNNL